MPLPPRLTHLVGSKFTATAELHGWRQFHVVGLRKAGAGYEAELRASCDATVEVRVPAKSLFDRSAWLPGWRPLSEL
ncbi:MAG: TIGR02450 family Trp-rich protein [Myxococcaceae bacterium]|nr:TIGR02450 family Trp-rich protein [Myxococcaceae bacterium]